MDVLLADVDFATKAGKYVMYVLAVAGGFLIGNLLTWALCRIVAKFVLKERLPVMLERVLRILGGLALAALVAFLLFRFGTGWGFGGSGAGEGDGTGAPTKGGEQPDTSKEKTPPTKVQPTVKEDPAVLATGMKVIVLPANPELRLFRLEGDKQPLTLAEVEDRIRRRHADTGDKLKFIDLLIYRDSVAEIHPDIAALEAFAHDLGLKTARKKLDLPLPD